MARTASRLETSDTPAVELATLSPKTDRYARLRDHLLALKAHIARIRPDRVHLNTAVRPTADPHVRAVPAATLNTWATRLGPTCEVIADFQHVGTDTPLAESTETIVTLLQRRPCSSEDVATGLGIEQPRADHLLEQLVKQGKIYSEAKSGRTFYRVPDVSPS